MRIAVVGKGGIGKSVIAGTVARLAARNGRRVLALDSDPLPGLSLSLGCGPDTGPPALLEAAERGENGQWGWRDGVDAVSATQRFAIAGPDGVRVVQRGKVGRDGIVPPAGASQAFWEIVHALPDAPEFSDWTLVGDLPAGPRPTADGWAPYAQTYVVVVQPTVQSALTARRVARIARQQAPGAEVVFVANRADGTDDVRHVERWIREPVLASVPDDEQITVAERLGVALIDHAPDSPAITAMRGLVDALEGSR